MHDGPSRGSWSPPHSGIVVTPQAQKQFALNEIDQMIDVRQREIRELQHKVLTLQEVRALVAAH
jgi:hypothetical protein